MLMAGNSTAACRAAEVQRLLHLANTVCHQTWRIGELKKLDMTRRKLETHALVYKQRTRTKERKPGI
jgi:hypothetical protein